jgi:hypothetical protein
MFKNGRKPGGTAMGIVVTYVVYLLISVALTVFVGSALSRSGRIFLLDVFGGQVAPAQAASRLVVVGFYLLNLGFVTLTMRMSGEIGGARQVIQVLSVKIGEVLLVLGGLYLANIGFLTRLRRRAQANTYQQVLPEGSRPEPPLPRPRGPEATTAPEANTEPEPRTADSATTIAQAAETGRTRRAKSPDQGLWQPRPRQAIH